MKPGNLSAKIRCQFLIDEREEHSVFARLSQAKPSAFVIAFKCNFIVTFLRLQTGFFRKSFHVYQNK